MSIACVMCVMCVMCACGCENGEGRGQDNSDCSFECVVCVLLFVCFLQTSRKKTKLQEIEEGGLRQAV